VEDSSAQGYASGFMYKINSMSQTFRSLLSLAKFSISILDHATASKRSHILLSQGIDVLDSKLPILIYVHYSRDSNLTEREVKTLQSIQKIGLQICVVFNSDFPLNEIPMDVNFQTCIYRSNKGLDLAAYRDAFTELNKAKKIGGSPIYFMNNSMIWFPESTRKYFRKVMALDADIFAGSISHQYRSHIQTFLFGGLNSHGLSEIENWLSGIKNWRMKRTIVRCGELSTNKFFSRAVRLVSIPDHNSLLEIGLKKIHENFTGQNENESYATIKRLSRNRDFSMSGIPINPNHDYWLELLEEGLPGIKLDLVRSNPTRIFDYEIAISFLLKNGFDYTELSTLLRTNKTKSFLVKIRSLLKW
jgi:hypothetical protein